MIKLTEEELARVTGQPRRTIGTSKYRAQRTEYGGRIYPSKAQADRAAELDVLKAAGKVVWWEPEVPISVHDKGVDRRYIVDFLVASFVPGGKPGVVAIHAEDVKGAYTPKFRTRVAQWRKRGPFDLHIIRQGVVDVIGGGAQKKTS